LQAQGVNIYSMKYLLIFIFFFACRISAHASPSLDSLLHELNSAIKQSTTYDNHKLVAIVQLKNALQQHPASKLGEQYELNLKLYEQYMYYNYDSALFYAKNLQQLTSQTNNSLYIDAKLKAVFLMLSGGMFKETFDSLNVISVKNVIDSVKAEYFTLMGRAYYNLADFNGDTSSTPYYNSKANFYLDSALAYYPSQSFDYHYYLALKFLKTGKDDSALFNLNKLIERGDLTYHQTALAASTIGGIYIKQGNENMAKPFLIMASIADIKSSTKETLALLTLAGIIYKDGKVEDAVLYIEKANADATFYKARLRKAQVGAILPLIEGQMIHTIQVQKEKLIIYLVLLGILIIALAGFAIIIRKQLTKLKLARLSLLEANIKQQAINQELVTANELKEKYNEQLKETNIQLVEANAIKEKYNAQLQETNTQLVESNQVKERYNKQLQEINNKLSEANKIKEEYIGYYFNVDTSFIARIEKLVTSVEKKLLERKWDEIRFILKSVDLKREKEELLKNFDQVFVRLFPNFVHQFNTMFNEEDKIVLKEDQLLNADLRIFALIRLGITENEKIAEILDYSINTIYAKKTKIRSKANIGKEELERKIMEITTLNLE